MSVQTLMAARIVAATFIDLASLVADETRWNADGYEIPDDSVFDDKWCRTCICGR